LKTTSRFIINASTDREGLKNHPLNLGLFENKKDAKKAMMAQANHDLTRNIYLFYRLEEQKTILHETYPSTETSE
jgi:5-keto 4-deoxyuronate isomerase